LKAIPEVDEITGLLEIWPT